MTNFCEKVFGFKYISGLDGNEKFAHILATSRVEAREIFEKHYTAAVEVSELPTFEEQFAELDEMLDQLDAAITVAESTVKRGEGKKWLPHTLKCKSCGTVVHTTCMIDHLDQLEQAANGFILANITPECTYDECASVRKMVQGYM